METVFLLSVDHYYQQTNSHPVKTRPDETRHETIDEEEEEEEEDEDDRTQ